MISAICVTKEWSYFLSLDKLSTVRLNSKGCCKFMKELRKILFIDIFHTFFKNQIKYRSDSNFSPSPMITWRRSILLPLKYSRDLLTGSRCLKTNDFELQLRSADNFCLFRLTLSNSRNTIKVKIQINPWNIIELSIYDLWSQHLNAYQYYNHRNLPLFVIWPRTMDSIIIRFFTTLAQR